MVIAVPVILIPRHMIGYQLRPERGYVPLKRIPEVDRQVLLVRLLGVVTLALGALAFIVGQ